MTGIEKFITLCMEQWPDVPLGFKISVSATGDYHLQVEVNGWLTPMHFSERDLAQPYAMIRTMKTSLEQRFLPFFEEKEV